MLLRKLSIVMLCASLSLGSIAAAERAPTALKPAVEEDFSSSVDKSWRVGKGDWKIVDGAWQGAELPADKHGAVARYPLEFTDAVIEFDFRLDGAKGISLSLNDQKGHVGRLSINPAGFQVAKDDHDHDGPDQRAVLGMQAVEFKPGTWHHVRVEIAGRRMTAKIDDVEAGGEHELIAVTKANFGFTVAGQSASFKNLRVMK